MKNNRALFISNRKYVDPQSEEGGVKQCTLEFINLIETAMEVIVFPVDINLTMGYRLRKKIGIAVYEDYRPENYLQQLRKIISENSVRYIFLNMTNTVPFSVLIKRHFPGINIILCSHGNESGDFLHEVSFHQRFKGIQNWIANLTLGRMLATESKYRQYIDLVLTVSDVELGIEKWLGAKKVLFIPRIIPNKTIESAPILGRVGFFGDLSHAPNYYGLESLLNILNEKKITLDFRIIGNGEVAGKELAIKYSFVSYLGYLPADLFENEIATWGFTVNPVFYYSRGVSTKLGKALALGIPVITTSIGMRGYEWKQGDILKCETVSEMALLIMENAFNKDAIGFYKNETRSIQSSAPDLKEWMNRVISTLES